MPRTVLVADDDERVLALVAATLENLGGVEVLLARDGKEALDIARREKPEVLVLDVLMPEMNGYEVCLALKRDPVTADAKVIMLTSLDQEFDRRKVFSEIGADDYLSKPFRPRELLEKVEHFLALQ